MVVLIRFGVDCTLLVLGLFSLVDLVLIIGYFDDVFMDVSCWLFVDCFVLGVYTVACGFGGSLVFGVGLLLPVGFVLLSWVLVI